MPWAKQVPAFKSACKLYITKRRMFEQEISHNYTSRPYKSDTAHAALPTALLSFGMCHRNDDIHGGFQHWFQRPKT